MKPARIIPSNVQPWEPELWHQELRQAYRSGNAVLKSLGLAPRDTDTEHTDFATLVPRPLAARMQPSFDDPILKQVLSQHAEQLDVPGFVRDPLAETSESHTPAPGLLHKYAGRALLIATAGCAVHCRYCFRRHFPYHQSRDLSGALQALAFDTSIREVILSGGDPLLLDDAALARLIERIGAMPHVQRLRFHTRLPIVLPQRTTAALLQLLSQPSQPVTMVLHVNHAAELDAETLRALTCLKQAGVTLLNQSVLLEGVNASADEQIELAETLFTQGVLPYYLHLPDRVAGTAHFFVHTDRAREIHSQMRAELPGYLLPRLVKEEPGSTSKTNLST